MEYNRIVLNSDQENAMKAARTQVKRKWDGEVVPRFSPKGKSQSNGVVEKAVQEVENQLRMMILALESRMGGQLELDHPAVFWLVEYVSELINRFEVRSIDQRTSYHRKYGNPGYQALAEFGEIVHVRPGARPFTTTQTRGSRRPSPSSRWEYTSGQRGTRTSIV